MAAQMETLQEMKANVIKAQDQIKRLTAVCWKLAKERDDLTKERDALAEDNLAFERRTQPKSISEAQLTGSPHPPPPSRLAATARSASCAAAWA